MNEQDALQADQLAQLTSAFGTLMAGCAMFGEVALERLRVEMLYLVDRMREAAKMERW